MKGKVYRVVVDVLFGENGREIYWVKDEKTDSKILMPDAPDLESGLFVEEDELDEYLEEHKDTVKVVKDYRD